MCFYNVIFKFYNSLGLRFSEKLSFFRVLLLLISQLHITVLGVPSLNADIDLICHTDNLRPQKLM